MFRVIMGILLFLSWDLIVCLPDAHALPAFARKYNVNCTVCHTRPPRLNTYGERFLENGYQLPGTEDGGTFAKKRLGDLTLGEIGNYLAFRLKGNIIRNFNVSRQGPGAGIEGSPKDKTEFTFPEALSLLVAGSLTHNVGIFVELETNLEEDTTDIERGFLTINNIYQHNLAHLRAGRLDPSAFWSFPTARQQMFNIASDITSNGSFALPTINRIALTPAAFAAKFSGLFNQDGTAIIPFDPSLFNATSEMGLDLHGRPFGDWFLYQIGIVNGANEKFGDSNNPKDWYLMVRLDHAKEKLFSANVSGFAYFGNNNAKILSGADINWSRFGIAGNARYKMIDVYGAFVVDRVTGLPSSLASGFDKTATGTTLETDILVTDRILLSFRFDHLDAGGTLTTRKSNTLVGFQGKYYLRSNIAFFLRSDINLRNSEGGTNATRNFRNGTFLGADLIF